MVMDGLCVCVGMQLRLRFGYSKSWVHCSRLQPGGRTCGIVVYTNRIASDHDVPHVTTDEPSQATEKGMDEIVIMLALVPWRN